MRLKIAILAIAALSLCGCATDPVPKGYTGPLAHVTDSSQPGSSGGVNFFFLAKFNGKTVDNCLGETTQANQGMGFSMNPMVIGRDVPAEAATFSIVGRTHYAAPILELMNKVYQVSGDVSFTPLPNHTYTVKGNLADTGSSVWIEDDAGKVMDKKIEVKDASLGLLQK